MPEREPWELAADELKLRVPELARASRARIERERRGSPRFVAAPSPLA
jgi:hypothetical protein